MTRSRYLEKCIRQGNACRDIAQNILPASNNLQSRDCLDHVVSVCVHQTFAGSSDDFLNSWRPLLLYISCGREFYRDYAWCLKSHLSCYPETSHLLVSFMCSLLEEMVKTIPCSPLPQHSETAFLSFSVTSPSATRTVSFASCKETTPSTFDFLLGSFSSSELKELNSPCIYCRESL